MSSVTPQMAAIPVSVIKVVQKAAIGIHCRRDIPPNQAAPQAARKMIA